MKESRFEPDCITRACKCIGWAPCAVSIKELLSLRNIAGTSSSHPLPKVLIILPTILRQSGRRPHNWAISRHSGGNCEASISATPASNSTLSCKPSNSSSTSVASWMIPLIRVVTKSLDGVVRSIHAKLSSWVLSPRGKKVRANVAQDVS